MSEIQAGRSRRYGETGRTAHQRDIFGQLIMNLLPTVPRPSSPMYGIVQDNDPRFSELQENILRRISVVMTRMGACEFTWTSPVRIPTLSEPKRRQKSAYFWLLRALMGVV